VADFFVVRVVFVVGVVAPVVTEALTTLKGSALESDLELDRLVGTVGVGFNCNRLILLLACITL